jgi:PhnB protein
MSEKIPDGVRAVIPMLVCLDAASEVEFCKTAFGAVELARRSGPDGTVVHATLTIGQAMVMIHGEFPTIASRAPPLDGSSSVVIYIYVEDVDTTIERAVAAGARLLIPVANTFWGDRVGRIIDPSGHVWNVAARAQEASSVAGATLTGLTVMFAAAYPGCAPPGSAWYDALAWLGGATLG